MPVGPDQPSESADNQPTELHFEEIEPVEIEAADNMEPVDPNHLPDDSESLQPESTEESLESRHAEPTSATLPDSTRTKAKHRWMMRAFFATILIVIYFLLYWQYAVR